MSTPQLPSTADVIIIGGGPAGTAAAWALARLDPSLRVLLLEQAGGLGAGASLASLECYRSCWPIASIGAQMRRSIEVFENAAEEIAPDAQIGLKRHGYLFLGFTPAQALRLRRDVEVLHGQGMAHIEYLEADEVQRRFPYVGRRVLAAKWDPKAGSLDSNALVHAFTRGARGLQVHTGVQQIRLRTAGGRVQGVSTAQGAIDAPRVLLAAGAGSRAIASSAGVDLPIEYTPRQSFTTGWRDPAIPEHGPMLIGNTPGVHMRPEAGSGAIFGWEYGWNTRHALPGQPLRHALNEALTLPPLKDPRFPSIVLALLARQFGHAPGTGFAHPNYTRGLQHNIGYYVSRDARAAYVTREDGTRQPYPSERALIDAVPGVAGLVVSVAHKGHGVMSAPAAGEIAAHHLLGLPLPHAAYADFGFDVPWAAYDEPVL